MIALGFGLALMALAIIVVASLRFARQLMARDERRLVPPPPVEPSPYAQEWLDHAALLESRARSAEIATTNDQLAQRYLRLAEQARQRAAAPPPESDPAQNTRSWWEGRGYDD